MGSRTLEKRGTSTTGLIVGVAVAFAVATVGAIVGLLWFWQRFRIRRQQAGHSKEYVRPDYSASGSPAPLLDQDLAPHPLPPPASRRFPPALRQGRGRAKPLPVARAPPDLARISEERPSMDPRASVETGASARGKPTPRVRAFTPAGHTGASEVSTAPPHDGIDEPERLSGASDDTQASAGHTEVLKA